MYCDGQVFYESDVMLLQIRSIHGRIKRKLNGLGLNADKLKEQKVSSVELEKIVCPIVDVYC